MTDFDSSYDSGGETTGENSYDSVDISENATEIGTEIDINETETNSFISIGDSGIDNSGKEGIDNSNGNKTEEIRIDASSDGNLGEISIDNVNVDKNAMVNVDESNASKTIEVNTEQDGKDSISKSDLDSNEVLGEYLEKESTYSMEVNKYISSPEELQVYKDAGLVEKNIDGRVCLIREDLDLEYVDKQSGFTNAELIAKGRSPYDAKTGERIELHHIGQDFNAPFAELQSVSEHDIYSKTLHKSEMDSWRRDPEKVSEYSKQRKAHWKNRI